MYLYVLLLLTTDHQCLFKLQCVSLLLVGKRNCPLMQVTSIFGLDSSETRYIVTAALHVSE